MPQRKLTSHKLDRIAESQRFDRMAMAEIRESGRPFDCLAFCGAIQRMLRMGHPEDPQK